MTNLSIIIPTVNRPEDLRRTLESILLQTLKPAQIIVVDQSDDNQSQEICDSFVLQGLQIDYYVSFIKSLTQARNFALTKVIDNSDIVIFLDDDVSFDSNFLSNLDRYIGSHCSVLGGTWKINSPTRAVGFTKRLGLRLLGGGRNNNQQIVTKTGFNQLFTIQPNQEQMVQWTSGCGMRFRKTVLDQGYYFPEKFLKYSIMEDLFLSYQIYCDYPGKLTYIPDVEMVHHESPNRSIPNYQKYANTSFIDIYFTNSLIFQ